MISWLKPSWKKVKTNVQAIITTRKGGVSLGNYAAMNLANHVGDDISHVEKNRLILLKELKLPQQPVWLEQIHSNDVFVSCSDQSPLTPPKADACITQYPGQAAAVLTADCLPILISNHEGTEVAAIHAGWRGLANGICESTAKKMHTDFSECSAWIGPAIGARAFEVGTEVRNIFITKNALWSEFFQEKSFDISVYPNDKKWLGDLAGIAENHLKQLGMDEVVCSKLCTFEQSDSFFSYRKQSITGRFASLIWMKD
ncbi:MAG: peptidoglycan editing factor PgeF [Pseudomonadota bacterium]